MFPISIFFQIFSYEFLGFPKFSWGLLSYACQTNPSPPRSTLKETMSQNLPGPIQNHNKNTSQINRVLRRTKLSHKIWPDSIVCQPIPSLPHTYIHTYIPTYMHTHAHTYTYIYTYILVTHLGHGPTYWLPILFF